MRKAKIIWFIMDILIAIFLFGFILALFYYIHGSFEMFPTEEQQEKAQIAAMLLMLITGAPCIICVICRTKYINKEQKNL